MLVDCNKNNADNNILSFRCKNNGVLAPIPPLAALHSQILYTVKYLTM